MLRARVGVLPLYLDTYKALPPGSFYPQSRDVSASIGPYLSYEQLSQVAEGLPRSDAERAVSNLVQRVVELLRDGQPVDVERELAAEKDRAHEGRKSRQPVVVAKTDGA